MAKMIPDFIDQEDPRRNGERMVFSWFSDSKIPGTVYYSMLQKNQRHKLIGEIDFLYISERGLICVEVKGGQDIYREGGEWFSVNRKGESNKIRNPFIQAKDCQYALKKYLAEVYGKYSEQSNYLVGYAVVFPECRFTGKGNDLVTEVMFDTRYDLDQFPVFIERVFDYWEKLEDIRHGCSPVSLDLPKQRQLNDLLRGDFHVIPSMYLEFQHIEQQMLKLTEEQYDVLDMVQDNDRAIVRGGAGTGKTLLALELARKYAARNKRVLYLCFNSNMAKYARTSLPDNPYLQVFTYHAFWEKMLSDDSLHRKSVREVSCLAKHSAKNVTTQYDVIVIDEGQDLFLTDVFDAMDPYLKEGIENGRWALFLDPNQNIFNDFEDYDITLEYLKTCCHPALLRLNTNCRNTSQIASRTAALTITKPSKNLKLVGPKVITRVFEDQNSFITMMTKELKSLFASGVSARDVVILSQKKLCNSLLKDVSQICGLNIIEKTDIRASRYPCLNYYTVQSFKGLESKVVFYIDIAGFSDVQNRMLNYVGMSRAKFQLYVFYENSKKEEYQDTLDKG